MTADDLILAMGEKEACVFSRIPVDAQPSTDLINKIQGKWRVDLEATKQWMNEQHMEYPNTRYEQDMETSEIVIDTDRFHG